MIWFALKKRALFFFIFNPYQVRDKLYLKNVGCKGWRRGHLVDIFREKSIIAIGWGEAGNLDNIK